MNKVSPFLFFLILGILLSMVFSSGQIENPDTHLRLTQARIYLEEGLLSMPQDVGEEMHGNVATIAGQRCMVYNPGQSLIFVPFYAFAKLLFSDQGEVYYFAAFLVSFINLIIHALSAYLLFRICSNLGSTNKQAYIVSLIFCFTSFSLLAAQHSYEHHFEMFLVLLSFLFATSKQYRNNWLYAGFAISLGLVFRNTTVFAIPALILLLDKRQILKFGLGLVPGFIFVLVYNYLRFDNVFETGYGTAWTLANGSALKFWSLERAPINFFGLLFSPAKGILVFSPTIVIGLFLMKKLWLSNRRIALSALVLSLTYLCVFAMNFAWHGSIWSFGPRYILPIVPFLYLPLVHLKLNKWFLTVLGFVFFGQVLLMSVNYKRALLSAYIKSGPINEVQYIYDWDNVPYASQLRQFQLILPINLNGKLVDYFPHEPWKKEVRTGSNESLIQNSLEKTSINFWWVRTYHEGNNILEKVLSVFVLFLAIIGSYFLTLKIKRYA